MSPWEILTPEDSRRLYSFFKEHHCLFEYSLRDGFDVAEVSMDAEVKKVEGAVYHNFIPDIPKSLKLWKHYISITFNKKTYNIKNLYLKNKGRREDIIFYSFPNDDKDKFEKLLKKKVPMIMLQGV